MGFAMIGRLRSDLTKEVDPIFGVAVYCIPPVLGVCSCMRAEKQGIRKKPLVIDESLIPYSFILFVPNSLSCDSCDFVRQARQAGGPGATGGRGA